MFCGVVTPIRLSNGRNGSVFDVHHAQRAAAAGGGASQEEAAEAATT